MTRDQFEEFYIIAFRQLIYNTKMKMFNSERVVTPHTYQWVSSYQHIASLFALFSR